MVCFTLLQSTTPTKQSDTYKATHYLQTAQIKLVFSPGFSKKMQNQTQFHWLWMPHAMTQQSIIVNYIATECHV